MFIDGDGCRESMWHVCGKARSWSVLLSASAALVAFAVLLGPRSAWAQSACQDFDEQCQTNGVCQADGTCQGTAKADGTGCNDGNECTTNDHCQAGRCTGGSNVADGTPCASPLGLCMPNAHCQSVPVPGVPAFCLGDLVECPQGADKCHGTVCDPRTGQCSLSFTNRCEEDCTTGECDPPTGECINIHPKADGTACDDGKECTTNDRCQSGECSGSLTSGTTTPQSTATPTPSVPATATHTATGSTPTPVKSPCRGDCNHDGIVTAGEIVTGVNIVLGNLEPSVCSLFDPSGDGTITVDDLLAAVNAALDGCSLVELSPTPTATQPLPSLTPTPTKTTEAATATPTATGLAVSPTPTASAGTTPSGAPIAQRAAGTIESTTSAFLVIPDLLSALLGHLPGASASLSPRSLVSVPFTCSAGGNGHLDCDQSIIIFPPSLGPPTYTIALNNCQATSSLAFNGTISADGQKGDTCLSIPDSVTLSTQNLTVQATGANGSTTATFTNLTAKVDLSCSAGSCQCSADTVDLALTGTMSVVSKDAQGATVSSTQVTFGSGSTISISVDQYAGQCTPVVYTMQVDGDITVATGANNFQGTFTGYTLDDDATSGQDMIDVSGEISSACFGATVALASVDPLAVSNGACPHAGAVEVTANGTTDLVTYTAGGGVRLDAGNDGTVDQTFGTCHDSPLLTCPGS